jgi:hypothetical protein
MNDKIRENGTDQLGWGNKKGDRVIALIFDHLCIAQITEGTS